MRVSSQRHRPGLRLAAFCAVFAGLGGAGCGPKQDRVTIPVCDAVDVNCRCTVTSWTICDHVCVDLRYDPANCGACGHACEDGRVCAAGTCALGCGALLVCNGRCAGDDDPLNCGSCGKTCAGPCKNGKCVPVPPAGTTCAAHETYCPGGCKDLSRDPYNCGDCGQSCPNGSLDICYQEKDLSYWCCHGKLCEGVCKDVKTDRDNCGSCGVMCRNSCSFGSCN